MIGTFSTATTFTSSNVLPGSCTETYTFDGTFTSATTFTATFKASFSGGASCLGCKAQTWNLTGSR
jgi:hypothetical protein